LIAVCTKDNPVQPTIQASWTITGNVQDGYTGAFLDSAQVVYADNNGNLKTVFTTATGTFVCPNLPYGQIALTVKYAKGATRYTTNVMNIGSGPQDSALNDTANRQQYKFRDTSLVVKLYSMNGSVNGTVQARKNNRVAAVVGSGVPIEVVFDTTDKDMKYASPRTFSTVSAADGSFKIDSLPIAPGAQLTILSATIGGITYAQKIITLSDLVHGSISTGSIELDTPVTELDPGTKFRLLYNNFPSQVVLPNGIMVWTFSAQPDSATSFAVLQSSGATAANQIVDSMSGNIFTVTPVASLTNGQAYKVTIHVYGKQGGSVDSTFTVTAQSSGAEEVVSSNVMTSTKQGITGLGLTDSMSFTLKDSISQATASVTHSGIVDLVTVSASGKNILITPKGSWLAGASYAVNVYGTLTNGTPFSFTVTVTTQGALDFATSNVFTPTAPTTGKYGFQVGDAMVIIANKPLASASAILTNSNANVQVPVSVSVSGDTAIVKPQTVLLFATPYTLQFSMTSMTGEVKSTSVTFTTTASSFYLVSSNTCLGGDATKPTTTFDPTAAITVTMSDTVASASATLTGGATVPVSVVVSGVGITITPTTGPLQQATTYTLTVYASSKKGVTSSAITVTNFKTLSALYLVSSNACLAGDQTKPTAELDPSAPITLTMSDTVTSASATLTNTAVGTVPVSVVASGVGITITPTSGALVQGATFNLSVSASNKKGISVPIAINGIQTKGSLYVVWSNVRLGNDPSKPVQTFDPLDNIVFVMSKNLVKATAQIGVPATVTINSGDTVVIHPQSALIVNNSYTVTVTVQDSTGLVFSGTIVSGLIPVQSVFVMASNVLTKDNIALTNVPITTAPWFKLSVAPVASSIKATITGSLSGSIDNTITVSNDTLIITPVSQFRYGENVQVVFNGMAINGKQISSTSIPNPAFTCTPAKNIRVVWSNVLNANLDGLSAVPVNTTIKVLLSISPKAGSITKTDNLGTIGNSVITLSGDTIVITPVTPLSYGTQYRFSLSGIDTNGIAFTNISIPSASTGVTYFTTAQPVFVVASNTYDATGMPIKTFPQYGTMWVKFSEALSTDKSRYTWANYSSGNAIVSATNALATPADINLIGDGTTATPNATLRISADTLFITPTNSTKIDYGTKVGFNVTVTTATGKTSTSPFGVCVQTSPLNLYVKATNTLDASGIEKSTFGLLDTVWVVSSMPLDSITNVTNNVGTLPDASASLLKSRVRLAATGDTIFYAPDVRLAAGTEYGLNFDVHIKGRPAGTFNTGVLPIKWKTITAVQISAMNLMVNSMYRTFGVINDSVVVSFSKAIDTSSSASTPFKVNGLTGVKLAVTWSADKKTATIKNIDTLTARAYSVNGMDYSADLITYPANYTLTFDLTCADGEVETGLAGGNSSVAKLAIKTEYALSLIGSNTIYGHTPLSAIAPASDVANDTFGITGQPTLVFNRAIDTSKIKADAVNQYQNYLKLVVFGSVTPVQFGLAFSSDAKTVTIVPASNLLPGTQYDIIVGTPLIIPGIGLKNANGYIGGGNANSILAAHDFKTKLASIDISALATTLSADTVNASSKVPGNRYGYSTGSGMCGISSILAAGQIAVRVKEAAWNSKHSDSVDSYQFRVKSGSGDWYILQQSANSLSTNTYNQFDPTVSSNPMLLDLTTESFYNNLLVPDGDGTGSGYSNGQNIFNGGNSVSIECRAVKGTGSSASYGPWSGAVAFTANVAPGDSVYTVSVSLTGTAMSFNNTGSNINPTNASDSSQYLTLTFPEDMDITTNPVVTFFNPNPTVPTAGVLHVALGSGWIDARTYRAYIGVPGDGGSGVNYSSTGLGWYFSVKASSMKDYNHITLETHGSTGAAANGTTYGAAVVGQISGNANVGGLHPCN
jgi:predicted RecA/RadA family phage recombinase